MGTTSQVCGDAAAQLRDWEAHLIHTAAVLLLSVIVVVVSAPSFTSPACPLTSPASPSTSAAPVRLPRRGATAAMHSHSAFG